MKTKLLIIFLLIAAICWAEEPFYIDFDWDSVKNYNKFQQDFFYLCKLLEDSHPALFDEIPEQQFIRKKQLFAGSLELVVNKQIFAVMLQKFVSQLNDGHTQIYYADGFGDLRVPVVMSWSGDDLYISNVNQGLDLNLIGKKVLRVGKVSADSLEKKLGPYVSAENRYWKRYQLTNLMNMVGFLLLTDVIDQEETIQIVVDMDGQARLLDLENSTEVTWLKPAEHPVTAYNSDLFSYKILPEIITCYFQFNEFNDLQTVRMYHKSSIIPDNEFDDYHRDIEERGGDFRIFLERMFSDIYQQKIDNLVIDLRNNGGGNSILANQFYDHIKLEKPISPITTGIKLSQLMQHYYADIVDYYLKRLQEDFGVEAKLPYYYDLDLDMKEDYFSIIRNRDSGFYLPVSNHKFDGKLYFLTDYGTFSSAGDMVTIAYDNDLGIVIGEPMGQKPTSYGDILYFSLPNSGIDGSVSHKVFKRPHRSLSREKTIYPDVPVKVDFYDKYLRGIDSAWDAAIKLINNDK
ncbi:MAG: S41 family peptidase [Candidatus Stygibacter frigidus]|nr:S41 family peptidase [Candidatus Stygibacter frigidus]